MEAGDTLGAASILPDGSGVSYDPTGVFDFLAVGEQGTDLFTYTVQVGHGRQATAGVTVTVVGVNDDPVAQDARFAIVENDAPNALGAVVAQDADSNDVLSFAIIAGDDADLFTIDAFTGELSTTGPLDFERSPKHELTVAVSDGKGGTDVATAVIDVIDVSENAIVNSIAVVDGAIFDVRGHQVLYLSNPSEGASNLHILNLSTGIDHELPSTGDFTPAYGFLSPNGAVVAARGRARSRQHYFTTLTAGLKASVS